MDKISTYDYLLQHQVKPSVQRLAVMDYLRKHKTHPTADDIYVHLLKEIPTLSKTTRSPWRRWTACPAGTRSPRWTSTTGVRAATASARI